jgi:hypothetical protein
MTFDAVITIVVILTAMATVTLWREAARLAPKPKKKFLTALLHSEPITPKHEPPNTVSGENDFPSLVTNEDRLFFGDFADFAAVVNWWLADEHVGSPWRIEELSNTNLRLGFTSDMPQFGRRYTIYHNQARLGTLEVSPDATYNTKEPNVVAEAELDSVRLLGFNTVQTFLSSIALHVSNPDPKSQEYFRTRQDIDRALTQVIWRTLEVSEFGMDGEDWGRLELSLHGSASWYLARRDALRKRQTAA